jgi:hypothetical protein
MNLPAITLQYGSNSFLIYFPSTFQYGSSQTGSARILACRHDSSKIPAVRPVVVAKSLLGSVDLFDYKFVNFYEIFRQ